MNRMNKFRDEKPHRDQYNLDWLLDVQQYQEADVLVNLFNERNTTSLSSYELSYSYESGENNYYTE